jgi:hypothetical protein
VVVKQAAGVSTLGHPPTIAEIGVKVTFRKYAAEAVTEIDGGITGRFCR